MAELKYYEIPIYGSKLKGIPESERALLVQLCHLLNEVALFYRMIAVLMDKNPSDEISRHAWISTSLTLTRFLGGRLYEAWELLRHGYFNSKLSLKIDPDLESEASDALKELKTYFKNPARLKRVRQFAFHFNNHAMVEGLDKLEKKFASTVYVPEEFGNSLYLFADEIVNQVMLDVSRAKFEQECLSYLDEVYTLAGHFIAFGQGVVGLLLVRYFGKTARKQKGKMKTSPSLVSQKDTSWPLFVRLEPASGEAKKDT